MRHAILSSIVAGLLISSTGCAALHVGQDAFTRTAKMFRPSPRDMDDSSDDPEEEWDFVGAEGRPGQVRESDPDPWFSKYLMSEKARSIERNVGF